jgi:hypothetical protein
MHGQYWARSPAASWAWHSGQENSEDNILTVWDLLESSRRRWSFALLGVILTVALSMQVYRAQGVYLAQVNVLFLLPASGLAPNALQVSNRSLVDTAGILQRAVGGPLSDAHPVSGAVTLAGEGLRHGYLVRLPNNGGQWENNFDEPMLSVQSVGTSVSESLTSINSVLSRIQAELNLRQKTAKVDSRNLIRTQLSPQQPAIYYLTGNPKRSVAITIVLGIGLTCAGVVILDRQMMNRRRSRMNNRQRRTD